MSDSHNDTVGIWDIGQAETLRREGQGCSSMMTLGVHNTKIIVYE